LRLPAEIIVDGIVLLLGLVGLGLLVGVPIAAFVALARTGQLNREIMNLRAVANGLRAEISELRRRQDAGVRPASEPRATPASEDADGRAESQRQARAVIAEISVPIEPAQPPAEIIPEPPEPIVAKAGPSTALDLPAQDAVPSPPVDGAPPSRPATARAETLEERLGVRLFIWVGGIALALAGAFLVKYSIDQGWLGPSVRCALGVALGLALLGGGEWMRARDDRIAQSVSAAGVAVLYASLFAAIALYDLIDSATGFLLLAGLTAGAIALALRQGPFVGLLGLAGGFLTPAIVRSDDPNALVLFGYLFAIQLGSQVLLRRRGWWWPSAIAVAGGFLWAGLWLGTMPRAWSDDAWLAVFLLGTAAAATWAQRAILPPARLKDWAPLHWQAPATHAVGLLLMAALVSAADFDLYGWLFLGLFAAGEMVLARFRTEHQPLVVLAAILSALLLAAWPLPFEFRATEASRFIVIALGGGALFALGGFAGLWGARHPTRWALLSALGTAAYFLIAYARLRDLDGLPPWGLVSLVIAALHVAAAERVARYRAAGPGYEEALGAFALAASFFIALAIPLELKHGWIAVGWALLLPAVAWIDSRLRIAWLRHAAWIAAGLVLLRLLPGPWIVGFPTGTTPIVNWLLYGYGIPLAAFAGAAWLFRRQADDALVTLLEAGAVAIGFLLVTLELHHFFHRSLRFTGDVGLTETASFVVAWLLTAIGLARGAGGGSRIALRWGTRIVAGIALAGLVGGPLLATNPLFWSEPVGGWPVFNWLLFAFALPALLLALLGREIERSDDRRFGVGLQILAGAVGLLFISLEIRQLFHGTSLVLRDIRINELSCLIIAWLAIALGLFQASGDRQALYRAMARVVTGLATAALVLGPLLLVNPLLTAQDVGTWPVLNWLIAAYLVPAALVAMLARRLKNPNEPWLALSVAVLSLVLGFAFVTLELRQWFHGSRLDLGGVINAETYSYSVGWILYGVALLAAGIVTGGAALRYASLAVIVLAVGKVFIVDTSALTGLYRVASFLGLGISLLAIGYAYQRFVFRREPAPLAAVTPPPTQS
jgi:uncharacterized membrane protein